MEPQNCPICNGKAIHYAPTLRTMANGDCHGSIVCTECGFYIKSDDDWGNNVLVDRWNNYTNQLEAHLTRTRPRQVRCPPCNRFMKHWYNNTADAKVLKFYCTCNTEDTVQATTFVKCRVSYHKSAVSKHWVREDKIFPASIHRIIQQWVLDMSEGA